MCTSWESEAPLVKEYEALIKSFPELDPELAARAGRRTCMDRKAMYLCQKDFDRHGLTVASGAAASVLHRVHGLTDPTTSRAGEEWRPPSERLPQIDGRDLS